jgi:dUTP pyrophosphatase
MQIRVRRLDPAVKLPARQHPGDAGYDLCARIDVQLPPAGGRALVPTGLALAIPEGYAGFVQPRSGMAFRHGVTCLNSPGLVDAGYRDEISVLLINHDAHEAFAVRRGDRVAQLVIQRVEEVDWDEVEVLDDTPRGLAGWGSTGRA